MSIEIKPESMENVEYRGGKEISHVPPQNESGNDRKPNSK